MEGYRDPFNRGTYPWGKENQALIVWYRDLGSIRKECPALRESGMVPYVAENDCFAFLRLGHRTKILTAVNRSNGEREIELPSDWGAAKVLLGLSPENGRLHLEPYGYSLLLLEENQEEEEE